MAAHLALSGGRKPKIVVAFPAGNSATALILGSPPGGRHVEWQSISAMEPIRLTQPDGTILRGVAATIKADSSVLEITESFLGNVRTLRQRLEGESTWTSPATMAIAGRTVTWQRRSPNGQGTYRMVVELDRGDVQGRGSGGLRLVSGGRGLTLRITALTGEPALVGICQDRLLRVGMRSDQRLLDTLAFLSFEDKLLAGSWRYNTYFGRDTLLVVNMLQDVLRPEPVEAALRSVLDRLSPGGEVAHEESVGELGRPASPGRVGAPILDYNMVDESLMLAPVLARYVLADQAARVRGTALLSRRGADGLPYGRTLMRNIAFVLKQAAPFAADPIGTKLVALKPGMSAGNWRDSRDGLAGGRYPWDVNVVLMPAALRAIEGLITGGLLDGYAEATPLLPDVRRLRVVWERNAGKLFRVHIPSDTAATVVRAYEQRIGLKPSADPLQTSQGIDFGSIALDTNGAPIPILHSDVSLAMLFGQPAEADLLALLTATFRRFPAGLATPIGVLSASGAFADPDTQAKFGPNAYAGSVATSWQQAALAIGLARQLGRTDLSPRAKATVRAELSAMMRRIHDTKAFWSEELWSWKTVNGELRMRPYGEAADDDTEANAVQLWSAAYLGLLASKPGAHHRDRR